MRYIIQSNTKSLERKVLVNLQGFEGDLESHPSLVNYPDFFEIIEGDLPVEYDVLNYTNS